MGKRDESRIRGYSRLLDPMLNKSTGFTEEERDRYGLRGLLPPREFSLKQQEKRVLANLRRQASDIDKYVYLQGLQDRNETLYFRVVTDHIQEIMPLIYTPTVGQACKEFAALFRRPRGLYITDRDRGRMEDILHNWPESDVRIIVVTDGERILGLGDLGTNGMGIPVGKLALYVACAGIHPAQCLPIMLDVGTNNHALREDPLYLGLNQERIRGEAYDEFVEEFIQAVSTVFPGVLVQFEDFLTPNAYRLLDRYRDRLLCFNDDIQGTAAVALAGLYAATRISEVPFRDQRVLFLGAGSAATGIGDLVVAALQEEGLSESEARDRLYFCNSQGLLTQQSDRLQPHNLPYVKDMPPHAFLETIEAVRPTALIGATGRPGTFSELAIKAMCRSTSRPVVFALSNPTANAECSAEEAYRWSGGKAIFASGSPFGSVEYEGRMFRPGQGNNAYVFPGIGLGALACKAHHISEGMFLAGARALAESVQQDSLDQGAIYPPLPEIRPVSVDVAVAVAEKAVDEGLAKPQSDGWEGVIKDMMYDPQY